MYTSTNKKIIFNITFIILNIIKITEKMKNSKNKKEDKEKTRRKKWRDELNNGK